jgi:hypothetical protein
MTAFNYEVYKMYILRNNSGLFAEIWPLNFNQCVKIRNVYSLEYTGIQKVLFTPHPDSHCCTNVILMPFLQQCDQRSSLRLWPFLHTIRVHCCSLGHSCTNVAGGHCRATVCSDNDLSSHWCATITPRSCRLSTPIEKSRQTDRHRQAHRVFFAHSRAWRTPNSHHGSQGSLDIPHPATSARRNSCR